MRPLYDDNAENPSAVTRDYVFDVDGEPPILSVFGGKITTYRKLAEHALIKLKPFFPTMGGDWTAKAKLPGGDMPDADFDRFFATLRKTYAWMPEDVLHHYARCYGTQAAALIGSAKSVAELGQHFGATLYMREIDYLRKTEWVTRVDDLLDRRTKHGLHLSVAQRATVEKVFE